MPDLTRNFSMTHFEWIALGIFLAVLVALQIFNKLPKLDSIKSLIAVMDSKGGNISVLVVMSIFFFWSGMKMFYVLLSMMQAKTLTADNAFALMGLQFVTGTAFGGAFGALLKTMTGTEPHAESPPVPGEPQQQPAPKAEDPEKP